MYDDSLFSFFKVGSDDSKCKEKINWCKFDLVMPSWPSKPRLNLRCCWDYWWDRWGLRMAISRLKSIQQHFRLHAWTRFCFISSVNKYQDLSSYLFHQLSCISHLGVFFSFPEKCHTYVQVISVTESTALFSCLQVEKYYSWINLYSMGPDYV